MGKRIDLIGKRFGRLLVVNYHGFGQNKIAYWECICDCGKEKNISAKLLLNGKTKSCGCLRVETTISNYTKHGQSKPNNHTSEFTTWQNMKARCYNSKNSHFKYYGGKGIVVCDRWLNSFENFFADMGKKPSKKHSLDRFPDKTGNYTPKNCRWATARQQANNKTKNRLLEYRGELRTMSKWSRSFKCSTPNQISYFLKKGRTMEWIHNHFKNFNYAKKKKSINFN